MLPVLAPHLKPSRAYLIGHPLAFICNSNEIDTCPANFGKTLVANSGEGDTREEKCCKEKARVGKTPYLTWDIALPAD